MCVFSPYTKSSTLDDTKLYNNTREPLSWKVAPTLSAVNVEEWTTLQNKLISLNQDPLVKDFEAKASQLWISIEPLVSL